NMNLATVDYMAELFDLYLALQHQNIPVDFIDEDDLTAASLRSYRVLYATEPDIPTEGQRAISAWVRSGGTLVTVRGTGSGDRYTTASTTVTALHGTETVPQERLLVPNLAALKVAGTGQGEMGDFTALGVRENITASREPPRARFADGSPAVIEHPVGLGRSI